PRTPCPCRRRRNSARNWSGTGPSTTGDAPRRALTPRRPTRRYGSAVEGRSFRARSEAVDQELPVSGAQARRAAAVGGLDPRALGGVGFGVGAVHTAGGTRHQGRARAGLGIGQAQAVAELVRGDPHRVVAFGGALAAHPDG